MDADAADASDGEGEAVGAAPVASTAAARPAGPVPSDDVVMEAAAGGYAEGTAAANHDDGDGPPRDSQSHPRLEPEVAWKCKRHILFFSSSLYPIQDRI